MKRKRKIIIVKKSFMVGIILLEMFHGKWKVGGGSKIGKGPRDALPASGHK
jgi:hypothetical protein